MEGLEISQRKSRKRISLALSPSPRHQRLPRRHPACRMETSCDRWYCARRHAASNDEDDSFGRRLGLRQGGYGAALRNSGGGDELRLSLPRSHAQQLGQRSAISSGNDSRFGARIRTRWSCRYEDDWTSSDEDGCSCGASSKTVGRSDRHCDESRIGSDIRADRGSRTVESSESFSLNVFTCGC